MRKKNRALVPSMNFDTPHPMNAAAGVCACVCVLLRIGAAPGGWRGPDLHTGWVGDGRAPEVQT
jgi:hypothetical protein